MEDRLLARLVADALRDKLDAAVWQLEGERGETDGATLERCLLDREADAVIWGVEEAELPESCRRLLERGRTSSLRR